MEIESQPVVLSNQKVPLLDLPNEITCAIFDDALVQAVEDFGSGKSARLPLVEVVLSHVCHQWRSVALSYPQLWSHFRYVAARSSPVPIVRFDTYLERSEPAGLELWLDVRGASYNAEDILTLLRKAAANFGRWKRFTLKADPNTDTLQVLKVIQEQSAVAPLLEHFAFCPDILGFSDDDEESFRSINALTAGIFKKGAPNLRSTLLNFTGAIQLGCPPLSNITTFRMEAEHNSLDVQFSWPVFCELLSLPSLVNLSIMGVVFHRSIAQDGNIHPVKTRLRHFRIADDDNLALLLPYIHAPLLESLIIKDVYFRKEFGTVPNDGGRCDPYVFPSLQSLSFINVEFKGHTARCFAKMTANVIDITFSDGLFDKSIFRAITAGSKAKERKKLWPEVRVLTFNMDGDVNDCMHKLVHFAKGRNKNEKLVLRLFKDVDERFQAWGEDDWMSNEANNTYAVLRDAYCIEMMDLQRNCLSQPQWPPPNGNFAFGSFVDKEDPFSIVHYVKGWWW